MKVLLVGNLPDDQQRSMLLFADTLARELQARGHAVRLLQPRLILGRLARPHSFWFKWLGYIDKFLLFPWQLRREAARADIVHVCDHSNGMYIPQLREHPHMVTCHDLIAVQAAAGLSDSHHVGFTGRVFQKLIRRGLEKAAFIACISQRTLDDVLKLGVATPERTALVFNGLNADYRPAEHDAACAALARLGLDQGTPYLLNVGLDLPHKNRATVLQTFAHLAASEEGRQRWPGLRMVFVGPELSEPMREFAQSQGLADRIVVLHDLSSDDLRSLYSCAAALLFLSMIEGFGWPIIEAQACACPVVVSDLPPMNQICGPAALRVDPRDPEAVAKAIIDNAERLAELGRDGLRNAARFSKARMIDGYEHLYQQLVAQQAPLEKAAP